MSRIFDESLIERGNKYIICEGINNLLKRGGIQRGGEKSLISRRRIIDFEGKNH
jgi:hypothetical protein